MKFGVELHEHIRFALLHCLLCFLKILFQLLDFVFTYAIDRLLKRNASTVFLISEISSRSSMSVSTTSYPTLSIAVIRKLTFQCVQGFSDRSPAYSRFFRYF